MSLLIKFIVVGNVGLRHKSQDISMIQYSCRIVKLAIFPHRKTYKNQRIHIPGLFCQSKQALPRTVQKPSLQKQILAGIPGNAKLRKYHDSISLIISRIAFVFALQSATVTPGVPAATLINP